MDYFINSEYLLLVLQDKSPIILIFEKSHVSNISSYFYTVVLKFKDKVEISDFECTR